MLYSLRVSSQDCGVIVELVAPADPSGDVQLVLHAPTGQRLYSSSRSLRERTTEAMVHKFKEPYQQSPRNQSPGFLPARQLVSLH